ncbi:4-fold beta flower protein [Pseudomonas chlororaphis]|uniref:4-fold beta flower protein n=1 Tax=Pseudomonas chlororaphis TaxID=587753 RepID=UPI00353057F8
MELYTKNGKPLKVVGSTVYSRSGKVVGRIKGEKVYGTDGRYVGTIIGGRLVYRSTHRSGISTPFISANRAGTAKAHRAASSILGSEPDIPD